MTSCTKSQTLMKQAGVLDFGRQVLFKRDNDPDEKTVTEVIIEKELYEDLGEPAEITLTIEPGDLLNEESPTPPK